MSRRKTEKMIRNAMAETRLPDERVLERAQKAMREEGKERKNGKIVWKAALCGLAVVLLAFAVAVPFVFSQNEKDSGETYISMTDLTFTDDPYVSSVNSFSQRNDVRLCSFSDAIEFLCIPKEKPEQPGEIVYGDHSGLADLAEGNGGYIVRIIARYQREDFSVMQKDVMKNGAKVDVVGVGMRERFVFVENDELTNDRVENIIVYPWEKGKNEFMRSVENANKTMTINDISVRYVYDDEGKTGYAHFDLDNYNYYTTVQTGSEREFIAHLNRLLYSLK